MKDFHTINNIFESPVRAIERNRGVLRLFVFAILVQGFEIKVENSVLSVFCFAGAEGPCAVILVGSAILPHSWIYSRP